MYNLTAKSFRKALPILTVKQDCFITGCFLASFNFIQKINKCQKCTYKCKRNLCYLLWLTVKNPSLVFCQKKKKKSEP